MSNIIVPKLKIIFEVFIYAHGVIVKLHYYTGPDCEIGQFRSTRTRIAKEENGLPYIRNPSLLPVK